MKKLNIKDEIGLIDDELINEADIQPKIHIYRKTSFRILLAAASFVIIAAVAVTMVIKQNKKIKLPLTSSSSPLSTGNISIDYTDKIPQISSSLSDLIYLSEDELFHKDNTVIFKGTIEKIDNIIINMNGMKEYRAKAEIKCEKIYRGDLKTGETILVLLNCPIDEDIWVEDTETVSAMREGMSGIFMPLVYDNTYYLEENGATLYFKDIADYGFLDGSRYAFLSGDNGLIFDKYVYESVKNAKTLDEIEEYVIKMIG